MKEKTMVNLESTDYESDQIQNYDYRFEAGKKDALFLHGLGLITTILVTIFMYAFGTGDPAQMTYFLGYPVWVSVSTVAYLVMFLIGMRHIWKWEEFPLAGRYKKGGK